MNNIAGPNNAPAAGNNAAAPPAQPAPPRRRHRLWAPSRHVGAAAPSRATRRPTRHQTTPTGYSLALRKWIWQHIEQHRASGAVGPPPLPVFPPHLNQAPRGGDAAPAAFTTYERMLMSAFAVCPDLVTRS